MGGGGVLQTNSNPKCQELPKFSFGKGEGGTPDQLKSEVPRTAQIVMGGGGLTPDQLKSKVLRAAQIFIFGGGG